MARFSTLLVSLLLIASLEGACTTHRRVDTMEYEDRRTGEPVTVERRTQPLTETSSEDTGVLSGTVNVIGEVIALPFRAVAGLVRAIF